MTQAGHVMGTFAYMPPEQAAGDIGRLDERADVFALGAILCEVLTGVPPYSGKGGYELWRQAREADLTGARERLAGCGADEELVELVLQCLAAERDQRPRHAGELANRLEAYLAGVQQRLEQARAERVAAEVQSREERKRRRLAVGLLASLLVLVIGAGGAGLSYRARQESLRARHVRLEADTAEALRSAEEGLDALHRDLADPVAALALPSEPSRWRGRLEAARAAADHARSLLASAELAVDDALPGRLAALDEVVQADEEDRKQAERLDRIRHAPPVYDVKLGADVEPPRAPLYLAEFARAGMDLKRGEPEQVAGVVRASRLRWYWVAALDEAAGTLTEPALRNRILEIVRRADPDPWRDRFRDPTVWADKGRLEALGAEPEAVSQPPVLVGLLAVRLGELGGNPAPLMRAALLRHPQDYWLHLRLASLCQNLPEGAACYRAALAIRPGDAATHHYLGIAYQTAENDDAAFACYCRAIQLDPSYLWAHLNLGRALAKRGRPEDAMRSYRNALAIDPRHSGALRSLGALLRDSGRLAEAIDCFHRAVASDPDLAEGHHLLGQALLAQGRLAEAQVSLRRAIALYPPDDSELAKAQGFLAECKQMLSLEPRLPALLAGSTRPANAGEALAAARLCDLGNKSDAAAQFYEAAFALAPNGTDPGSLASSRFAAATAAAQAVGSADTRETLSDERRAKLRRLALSWLRDCFGLCSGAAADTPVGRAFAREVLDRCRNEKSFVALRQESDLARLPEAERSAWMQLWVDAARLRLNVEAREMSPFVLVGRGGKSGRRFDALAKALAAAADGDVVEVRGNGPFDQPPLAARGKTLTVRAGAGASPVLRFRGADRLPDGTFLAFWKVASGGITLEGLDLRLIGDTAGDGYPALVGVEGGPMHVAGCRFRYEGAKSHALALAALGVPVVNVMGCEFTGPFQAAILHHPFADSRLQVERCLVSGPGAAVVLDARSPSDYDVDVILRRNTIVGGRAIDARLRAHDAGATANLPSRPPGKGVRVVLQGNVLGGESPHCFYFLDARREAVPTAAEGVAHLRRVVRWQEKTNLYAEKTALLVIYYGRTNDPHWGWLTTPVSRETIAGDLASWDLFWELKATGSRAAPIRFVGGTGLRLQQALREAGPAACLLHPDTLKGLDDPLKQQLGIPADLVGPGAAYEGWKRTPAYQEWLKAIVAANLIGSGATMSSSESPAGNRRFGFADSSSPIVMRAEVRSTSARTAFPPICFGHIDRRIELHCDR
jgi:serine/threonine-protein kinase